MTTTDGINYLEIGLDSYKDLVDNGVKPLALEHVSKDIVTEEELLKYKDGANSIFVMIETDDKWIVGYARNVTMIQAYVALNNIKSGQGLPKEEIDLRAFCAVVEGLLCGHGADDIERFIKENITK